jgi:DUF971 family protein
MTAARVPVEIRVNRAERVLVVRFADGSGHEFAAEYLRVESPSAEVKGHGAAEKRVVAGKRAVSITAVEPVGHYALRIAFDDGHDTGLFSWEVLDSLAREYETRWPAYLAALAARGLTR